MDNKTSNNILKLRDFSRTNNRINIKTSSKDLKLTDIKDRISISNRINKISSNKVKVTNKDHRISKDHKISTELIVKTNNRITTNSNNNQVKEVDSVEEVTPEPQEETIEEAIVEDKEEDFKEGKLKVTEEHFNFWVKQFPIKMNKSLSKRHLRSLMMKIWIWE